MQRRTRTHNYRRAMDDNTDHGAAMTLRHKGGLHHSECKLLM